MELQLPVVFNDRYQLIKKIGEGGLAEVYQAQDMALGRLVAVKVLRPQYTRDPNFLVNFHKEAQSAAKLSDAHIVAVYDFGQDKNRPYIVMEWIPGSDLRAMLDEQGLLVYGVATDYAIQTCSAVGTAHRAGLVHGDLKPGNILITPANQVKVTDFGLARALGASAMDAGEVVWGTPAYFAPEQAAGDRVLPATDVYAIGIILYEMLTGRVPFIGADDQDVARKQIYEAHVPVDKINPRLPEPLARIIDAAMAKNINERFLTADHLREALIMFKQGGLAASSTYAPISAVLGSPLQNSVPMAVPPPPPPPRSYIPAAQAATQRKKSNVDWLMWGLGLIAILAVIGLIPLFVAVYATYIQEPSGNTSPGLPTLVPGQIRMPYLVGLDENTAKSALQNMGLALVVEEEEPHPELPAFTIIRQSVQAGEPITPGSQVSVVLSQGPPLIELPNLTGRQYDEAAQQLESLNLIPQKYEDWSAEPLGKVISQDPPPGSLVANKTPVTLVVSSGSRVPVGANLGGQIVLSAYEITRIQFKAGEPVNLTFFWQAVSQPAANYSLFIHLTTPQGGIVNEIDTQPQAGVRPTSTWGVGDTVVDPYQIPIPPTTASGDYQIRIGFYNTETKARLPIFEPGRAQQDNLGALILRSIQVVP
jgi:serine/threonine-protein kinase